MDEHRRRGNSGEAAVADYLRRRRYRIVASQYRCRFGEIDLIARSPEGVLCFVEVKARGLDAIAPARTAVTPAKQRRLRTSAEIYLAQYQLDCPCRFDVAEVYPGPLGWGRPVINDIESAF